MSKKPRANDEKPANRSDEGGRRRVRKRDLTAAAVAVLIVAAMLFGAIAPFFF